MKSLLEIWVLRTSSLGRPGAHYPQEKLWDTDLQNVTYSITDQLLPPGIERKGHIHIHTW